jgi:hypothetical protein
MMILMGRESWYMTERETWYLRARLRCTVSEGGLEVVHNSV